ncbi:glycosyltransferase [uncultured Vibrio sp.]|uniref:glycosyltransferase n=1 Tax=uncultured Vibrio sp. TaxID=114054 RepID=UPI0025D2F4BC|nr:glycosyltransferase [uncultured Vibrio sp.]
MKTKKILAVASGGGHWVQLRRLQKAFSGHNQVYVTVKPDYKADIPEGAKFYTVRDATRWDKFGLIQLLFQLIVIVYKERPDVVVSTGAAPGFFALRLGRLFGAKTIWIDSIANVEKISLSGKKVSKHVDHCLTQWKHLDDQGCDFKGNCL